MHLQQHQFTGQRNDANIVTWLCFDGHDVAFFERQMVVVAVKTLSRVFELHLDEVSGIKVTRHVGQIVESIELAVAASASGCCNASQGCIAPGILQVFELRVCMVVLERRFAESLRILGCIVGHSKELIE